MFYLILALNLAVLALVAAFVIRLARASKEGKGEILSVQKNKRAIIFGLSVFVAIALIVGGAFFFLVGTTGIHAGSAAKDFLREKYGASETWELSFGQHTERSKKPASGNYEISYLYAGKSGVLSVEYTEHDGKISYRVTPKER